ncbi:hypothetical protein C8R47DRAFT_1078778 [Mycena vitilis]|nr:hypothetical protein C8R47DRAFT_1078778 [Mycena vitilis]
MVILASASAPHFPLSATRAQGLIPDGPLDVYALVTMHPRQWPHLKQPQICLPHARIPLCPAPSLDTLPLCPLHLPLSYLFVDELFPRKNLEGEALTEGQDLTANSFPAQAPPPDADASGVRVLVVHHDGGGAVRYFKLVISVLTRYQDQRPTFN